MEIKYQVYENNNLLIQKFSGDFNIAQYMQYNKSIMKNINPEAINKVIIDFRDINLDDLPDDFFEGVEKMIKIRRNIVEKEIKRKDITHVFQVDKPLPTAMSQMFIQNFPDMKYHCC